MRESTLLLALGFTVIASGCPRMPPNPRTPPAPVVVADDSVSAEFFTFKKRSGGGSSEHTWTARSVLSQGRDIRVIHISGVVLTPCLGDLIGAKLSRRNYGPEFDTVAVISASIISFPQQVCMNAHDAYDFEAGIPVYWPGKYRVVVARRHGPREQAEGYGVLDTLVVVP